MIQSGVTRPRADARRNRALVLQAARFAFEEQGLGVPLGEIARRAGVGAGTVYRHFPSKEALFRATIVERIELFTDTARDLAEAPDPGAVFFRFLSSVVRLASRNKALCDALEAAGAGRFEPSPGVGQGFDDALEVLLGRAQEAGAVRRDVGIADLRALLVGCLSMERARAATGAEPGEQGRMTALMCDALRPPHTVTAVTKPPGERMKRNEARCGVCGAAIAAARTGRPPRYCGGACRQKAHRTRGRTQQA
ncbi:transcriptional regulator, TetR family [Streptomyces sp. 2224.1]|uniref:TetR/AcrR family transcriptional regulator n=1 Tax=unclassified Streptomyces TaxID=2593676 RepID=UPI000887A22C|nr:MULTISPECIES: TetR/AcrR family transcriptional regulator [unclassified Streptomyces]PBC83724.1 TetR family transcriptional regulator [Streptomyces sp. 2321.6]SDR39464.1 transcriptional regulator, TetR family [Streptomyces sp. KS_16]SEB96287.1 transcriptional regulator, TetR family [Streptomyces sp. 2224.1]SED05865.1 transcriptional regulator, TetR family [Streptomyces sp. 2133.1]SEE70784.1 transcriptional regulator, TetR family [Streptomyces sp. 2112.3]